MHRWVGWMGTAAALLTLGGLSRAQPAAPDPLSVVLERLSWRNVGPAIMGGRIDDFAVPEGQPGTLYMATASGGLFKTTNNGTTWEALFDGQPRISARDTFGFGPGNGMYCPEPSQPSLPCGAARSAHPV